MLFIYLIDKENHKNSFYNDEKNEKEKKSHDLSQTSLKVVLKKLRSVLVFCLL